MEEINNLANTKNFSSVKESEVKPGEDLTTKKEIILPKKGEKSICKIIKEDGYGSGFFCEIKLKEDKEICCLLTNNHVITEYILNNNEYIEIKLKNIKYKINLGLKRRIWSDEDLDFTCIEIIDKDNIISNIEPLELDENIYKKEYNIKNYNEKGIAIAGIGAGGDIELTKGVLYYVHNRKNAFLHDCNTEHGFSGGPILLISNLKIMGIHLGYEQNNNYNYGIYLKEVIKNIRKAISNIIICEIEVQYDIETIILFKGNENNKEEIEDNLSIYMNNKEIGFYNYDNKYKISYKFKEDKKYEITIIFKNKLNNLANLFEGCKELISIDLSSFDTSNVNDMEKMFFGCEKLKQIKGINNLNTSNVTNMSSMFDGCCELEYLDLSNLDTSKVDDMGFMFSGCNKLKEIKGINQFNTSNATDMFAMFQHCYELEYLDLSSFDMSNVKNMGVMFSDCNKLKEIKGINKFNTSNATNMGVMFQNCFELEYLDLSNFYTSNVKDMNNMFFGCEKLKEIKGINDFNTSNVNNMGRMFKYCIELEYLDLSNFDTTNVNDMEYMFFCCEKLKYLNIENFVVQENCKLNHAFEQTNKFICIAKDQKIQNLLK